MRVRSYFAVLLALVAVSCGQTTDPNATTTTPTGPTTNPTTETHTGTVPVGGSDVYPFNILLANGQLSIILTAAGPPPTIQMGLAVGLWVAPTCTILTGGSVTTPAGATAQLSGTASSAGAYCVQVSDVGNQTAPVNYSITVIHY